jgi:hypothetical protein
MRAAMALTCCAVAVEARGWPGVELPPYQLRGGVQGGDPCLGRFLGAEDAIGDQAAVVP